jgi:predicted lipid-binding transport protein (Tim44 family)
MKTSLFAILVVAALGLVVPDVEAAKRFGGGGSLGKQRDTPAMKDAPKQPAAAPAQPAAPAATPAATPQPQPSFMSRFGGVIAGLGIGALLGSMFSGGGFGSGLGMIFMVLAVAGIGYMIYRAFASRGASSARPMEYAGAGAGSGSGDSPLATRKFSFGGATPLPENTPQPAAAELPPGFVVEPFLRQARIAFIRLQAANDAKDLDDIRDYTTPEMYAQIAMQLEERGSEPQKTDVVAFEARLVEAVVENGYEIASVRYTGTIREQPGANPEPFDEVWHVRKKANDPKDAWLIAGIQQLA